MNKKIIFVISLAILAGLIFVAKHMSSPTQSDINNNSQLSNVSTSEKTSASSEPEYVSYYGEEGEVYVVPDSITEIQPYAFYRSAVSKVILPKGLKKIGRCAFSYSNIEEIEIPAGVTKIEDSTFTRCERLKKLKLNEGLVSIGNYAFEFCDSLNEYFTLPSTVQTIGDYAFGIFLESCDFDHGEVANNIEIPKNSKLRAIGPYGLHYANKIYVPKTLHSVQEFNHPFFEVPDDHSDFCSVDGVLFNKDTTVLLVFPNNKGGDYIMPNSVRIIAPCAFGHNNVIEKIVLSSNLDSIAFPLGDSCSYKNLEISAENPHFCTIDGVLFSHDVKKLLCYPQGRKEESYEVPEKVRYIESYAFMYCCTNKITMPKRLKEVAENAFCEPLEVKRVDFPGGKCKVHDNAFGYYLIGINIDSINYIGEYEEYEDE